MTSPLILKGIMNTKNKMNDGIENLTEEEGVCVECYEDYLREKGVSDDGFYINPKYMTEEDELVIIEVKKVITDSFEVRVHKDHKGHFNVEDYMNSEEVWSYWECSPPHELINGSLEYRRVEKRDLSSEKDRDFFHYVCCDGVFYKPDNRDKKEDSEIGTR